jgi:hypothetical protein
MAKQQEKETNQNILAFDRMSYILLLAGVGILALGYVLMIGGGSDDPKVYNPAIFNFQRITLSPITLLVGFGVVLYAIIRKPKH